MLKVIELAFCCYAVTDIKRSRDFYEGVLGLKPTTIAEDKWVEYEFRAVCTGHRLRAGNVQAQS